MHISTLMLVATLFYLFLILISYFRKERIRLLENKIYESLLITTIIGVVIDFFGIYAHLNFTEESFLRWFIVKIYLLFLLTFVFLLTLYIIFSSAKNKNNSWRNDGKIVGWYRITAIIYSLSFIINLILPFEYFKDGNSVYVSGPNTIFVFAMTGVAMLGWLLFIALNYTQINKEKYFPIILFVIIGAPLSYIQMIFPDLLLVTGVAGFIVVLMYHTIENPDVKLLKEMNLAKLQAEKANRAKTDFLSSMSHEIRTPLNAIVGFSELNEYAKTLDEAKENSKEVVEASKVLLEIVNGVLDISRIESGNMDIKINEYNPRELVESAVKLVENKINEKKLKLNVNIAEDIPEILLGDKTNIKKIVTNLLSNAVKYTDEGNVDFIVQCVNNKDVSTLIISVEDTGRGIKKENIDKLFTKFNRLEEDLNTTTEGTGLGLAITKSLVEMIGGKIVVQSVYGSGSKFTATINQGIPTTPDRFKNVPEVVVTDNTETITMDINEVKRTVLAIDDNKINLKILVKLLSEYNLEIDSAYSAQEAIDKINEGKKYDIILTDDMMPNMSGTEMMKKLKDYGYDKPIVVLTANAMAGEKEKYLAEGFDDYIGKPIDKKLLNDILSKY